jgi:hypothetical protein
MNESRRACYGMSVYLPSPFFPGSLQHQFMFEHNYRPFMRQISPLEGPVSEYGGICVLKCHWYGDVAKEYTADGKNRPHIHYYCEDCDEGWFEWIGPSRERS